jgi:hypothetical protein
MRVDYEPTREAAMAAFAEGWRKKEPLWIQAIRLRWPV